jgi:hypothetical protein
MSSKDIPLHQYVWVWSSLIREGCPADLFEPAVWFAIRSEPGRAWGCHVMLECGAVYRNLPPHSISFAPQVKETWGLRDAQVWDCYGHEFDVVRYQYLADLRARYDGTEKRARYLFTACPRDDGFSAEPEQSKEFMFMRTDDNRLLIRPTNMLLFEERSFTEDTGWPSDLRVSRWVWRCEG